MAVPFRRLTDWSVIPYAYNGPTRPDKEGIEMQRVETA